MSVKLMSRIHDMGGMTKSGCGCNRIDEKWIQKFVKFTMTKVERDCRALRLTLLLDLLCSCLLLRKTVVRTFALTGGVYPNVGCSVVQLVDGY